MSLPTYLIGKTRRRINLSIQVEQMQNNELRVAENVCKTERMNYCSEVVKKKSKAKRKHVSKNNPMNGMSNDLGGIYGSSKYFSFKKPYSKQRKS